MLFTSGVFLFFFAAIYALYLISAHKVQNRLLLLASYVFYGYWDYRFLGLILISTAIDYVVGLRIQASREAGDIGTPRRWLLLSIVGNLSILAFFKYFEPRRVYRRLQLLRGLEHEQIKSIFPRG